MTEDSMKSKPNSPTPTPSKEEEHRFRMSQLNLQNSSVAHKLGTSSGHLNVEKVVDELLETRDSNKLLTKVIIGLVAYSVVLTAAIFGVSIAAAEIAKETTIDPSTGFVHAKHGQDHPIVKTAEALVSGETTTFHGLPNEELANLKSVSFEDGAVIFQVNGFSNTQEKTSLLVEGGVLTFDDTGLSDVTGNHTMLVFESFGIKNERRKLHGDDGKAEEPFGVKNDRRKLRGNDGKAVATTTGRTLPESSKPLTIGSVTYGFKSKANLAPSTPPPPTKTAPAPAEDDEYDDDIAPAPTEDDEYVDDFYPAPTEDDESDDDIAPAAPQAVPQAAPQGKPQAAPQN